MSTGDRTGNHVQIGRARVEDDIECLSRRAAAQSAWSCREHCRWTHPMVTCPAYEASTPTSMSLAESAVHQMTITMTPCSEFESRWIKRAKSATSAAAGVSCLSLTNQSPRPLSACRSSHSRHIPRRPLMQLPLLQLDLVLIPPQQLLPVRIEVSRVLAPHPPRLVLEPCLADLEVGVMLSGRQVLEGYPEGWLGRWGR